MIKNVQLKFGSKPGAAPLAFETAATVTIFVGPNNSGKSQALRELDELCREGRTKVPASIIEKLEFIEGGDADAGEEYEALKVPPRPSEHLNRDASVLKFGGARQITYKNQFIKIREHPNLHQLEFAKLYLKHKTINLDGSKRIKLLDAQPRGDLKDPESDFARLFVDDAKRGKLRKTIHSAVGMYLCLDPSDGGGINIRFSSSEPEDERSLSDRAVDFMKAARSLEMVSDGVKAFTGILLQISVGEPDIVIIDEPEAFLHPSLALQLGREIARSASDERKMVFVATHSPQFVMGALLSGARVNLVRLTYDGIRLIPLRH